jgi:hypothetical protein
MQLEGLLSQAQGRPRAAPLTHMTAGLGELASAALGWIVQDPLDGGRGEAGDLLDACDAQAG